MLPASHIQSTWITILVLIRDFWFPHERWLPAIILSDFSASVKHAFLVCKYTHVSTLCNLNIFFRTTAINGEFLRVWTLPLKWITGGVIHTHMSCASFMTLSHVWVPQTFLTAGKACRRCFPFRCTTPFLWNSRFDKNIKNYLLNIYIIYDENRVS